MTGEAGAAAARRALLIGVRETPYLAEDSGLAARYPALDFVDRDLSLIRTALEDSDYEVEVRGEDTGRGPVIGAISRFFASCAPGDTALLYFSGHGEAVSELDHLVLTDSQADVPAPDGTIALDVNTLLRADPSTLLRRLPKGVTAIICLDICRSGGARGEQRDEDGGWLADHNAYWLYSCGAGQRSYADPVTGSWFAQAFTEALSRVTPPTTFHEVARYTATELTRIADEYGQVDPPTVAKQLPWPLRDGEHRDPVICEGSEQTLEWTRVIRDSGLWRHTSGPVSAHERIKGRLAEIVRWVVESSAGTAAHREDPWSDPRYPARVEERLSALVEWARLTDDELLSPAETACLLAAAVVQEGVVAVALDELRRLLPGRIDPGPRGDTAQAVDHADLVREAARDVCRAHTQVVRAADTLRRRNLKEATAAADHWLRHRFIADWDRLWEWEPPGSYPAVDQLVGLVVEAIEAAADTPAAGPRTDGERREIDRQVRQVLGHLTVKPDRSPRINDSAHGEHWIDRKPIRGNQWRGHQLARLLWTAGLLAADPRRLSSVLVDHLGAHEPIVARQVASALHGLDYDTADGRTVHTHGLAMRFDCPHPALHAALEELTVAADATVQAFRQDAPSQPLLRGLPDRVAADELRPMAGRYKDPLERFRLAEDEIRPLLMGTQLYGDRMLAVRELYQNALDACRYRDMRRQYGRLGTTWEGTIAFTQGRHEGRPYIECLDNGSGMTRTRLTSMFARAGKRYEQDPEFVQERRNWRREGITEQAMNSRFGIGVFSYFMLADEVVVWTRPVDRFGRVGAEPALRADIQSGSGLLQIGTSHDAEVPEDGGTRVRLYLAEPQEGEKHPSLVETLRKQLWVTEHRVSAEERGESGEKVGEVLEWTPGQLVKQDDWPDDPLPVGMDGDLWLVQGHGQLLLDGVLIPDASPSYGCVINLRERHSPVPSVDRNQLLSYDKELVMCELLGGVAEAVGQCTEVSLPWLWRLSRTAPRVAIAVLDALSEQVTATLDSVTGSRLGTGQVQLAKAGCFPCDENIMNELYGHGAAFDGAREDETWLLQEWQSTRLGLRQARDRFDPEGYPEPIGLDAALFQHGIPREWVSVLQMSAQLRTPVRVLLRALRRHAIMGIRVPAVQDLRSLSELTVTQPAADLYSAYVALREHTRRLMVDVPSRFLRRSRALSRQRPPAPHAPMLAVSSLHDMPLGELSELLLSLSKVDPELPMPPELGPALADRRVSRAEVSHLVNRGTTRLTSPWSEEPSWLPGTVGPVDLLHRAGRASSLEQLARLIEEFRPFGFSLDEPVTDEARALGSLPPDQQLLLSDGLDRTPPWHEHTVSVYQLLHASEQSEATLGVLAERINALTAATRVRAPELPAEAAQWVAPDWVTGMVHGLEMVKDSPLRPWQLVGGFIAGDGDIAELPDCLAALDSCGLIDWGTADRKSLEQQIRNPHPLLIADPDEGRLPGGSYLSFSGDFSGEGATPAYCLALAASSGKSLGTVCDELAELKPSLALRISGVPPEARELQPSVEDVRTLNVIDAGPERFRPVLTIGDLLTHCSRVYGPLADSVRHLAAFSLIGAPAPPGHFTGPDAALLADFRPGLFDHAAFDDGLLGPGVLGPLELVLVAGRFGWPLGQTYNRYAPFRCLGLEVTTRAPDPDEERLIPDWRDVILLTEQLTGRPPALTGQVSQEHITLCAEETDLDEEQVRERLDRYAAFFGLVLPPPEEDKEDKDTPS
ncbi:caspase family protein [Streptomyces sp. NPDC001480]|uniref:HD domain-containing protein n=1 Tax=Streptomyces sp. NPDC001480 TaxID=3364577 RepID=UPI0036A47DC2